MLTFSRFSNAVKIVESHEGRAMIEVAAQKVS